MESGIFKITNIINGKFYIGSSVNVLKRWAVHKSLLNQNKHHSPYLQNSWNKYGKDNFIFEILEYCNPDKNILMLIEQMYLDLHTPKYNTNKFASSPLGYKHTLASKDKMRIRKLGSKLSDKHRIKLLKVNIGKTISSQHRLQIKVAHQKAVLQYCRFTNVFLAEFVSIKDAGKATNIHPNNITAVLKGRSKYTKDYIWKYKV